MSQYSDHEQYDDSFSESDNEILQSGEGKSRNTKAGYSSFADQEDLMEELSNALDSKNDTPKQQSRKLRKLLRLQEKPKQKGKGGGFKLKKSFKEKSNKHKAMKSKEDNTVFGVSLLTAVQRSRIAADGIELPTVFRECIDFLEENGLMQEGIYRLSGMKSKIEELKTAYDKGEAVDLSSCDANVVASLLKQYLRELPDSLLTLRLQDKFEQVTRYSNSLEQVEIIKEVIAELPSHNRLMLGWLMVHMSHIVENVSVNKMGMPNIIIVLSPTLQTSPAVLCIMLTHVKELFDGVVLTKYVRPQEEEVVAEASSSSILLDSFDTAEKVVAEIERLGSILQKLHGQMAGKFNENEERIWELQRTITNLRRKLKSLKSSPQPAPAEPVGAPEDFLTTLLHMEATLLAEKDVLLETNEMLKGEIKKEAERIEQCKAELSKLPPDDEFVEDFFEDVDVAELAKQVASLKWQRKELQIRSAELKDAIIQERDTISDLNIKLRLIALNEQTAMVS